MLEYKEEIVYGLREIRINGNYSFSVAGQSAERAKSNDSFNVGALSKVSRVNAITFIKNACGHCKKPLAGMTVDEMEKEAVLTYAKTLKPENEQKDFDCTAYNAFVATLEAEGDTFGLEMVDEAK